MKTLDIPRISARQVWASEIPMLMDKQGMDFQPIGHVCWPHDYPYAPRVAFRLAHADDGLLLHYHVEEETVKAVAEADNGSVWEDSCCEFFMAPDMSEEKPSGHELYYNFECNCCGTLLIGVGEGREGRQLASPDVLEQVDRWSTWGRGTLAERSAGGPWELALSIPYAAFFQHPGLTLAGKTVGANFYKCGDKLPKPHFLSWNPVEVPSPDFHRPDYFGRLHFLTT